MWNIIMIKLPFAGTISCLRNCSPVWFFWKVPRRIIGRTIVKCIKTGLKILGGDQQWYGSKRGN